MFVIDTNKQPSRQFNLVNNNISEKLNQYTLRFYDCYSTNGNTETLVNSTTRTPNNWYNLLTLGATQINGQSAHALEEFLYTGNPYTGFDLYATSINPNVTTFGFTIPASATRTNYTSTWRFVDDTSLPAGLTVGANCSLWLYHVGFNAPATFTTFTVTVSCTIKLMSTTGTLTIIGTTQTESLISPVGINTGNTTNIINNPLVMSGSGVTSSAGDRIVIEPTITVTSIVNASPSAYFLSMCFTAPGSANAIRNRQSTISIS